MSEGKKIYFGLPRDRSLAAFREWVMRCVGELGGDATDTLTEQQWTEHWQRFWANAGAAEPKQS